MAAPENPIAQRIAARSQTKVDTVDTATANVASSSAHSVDTNVELSLANASFDATPTDATATSSPVHIAPLNELYKARGHAPQIRQLKNAALINLTDDQNHQFYSALHVPGADVAWCHGILNCSQAQPGDLLVVVRSNCSDATPYCYSAGERISNLYINQHPTECYVVLSGDDAPRTSRSRRSTWALLRFPFHSEPLHLY